MYVLKKVKAPHTKKFFYLHNDLKPESFTVILLKSGREYVKKTYTYCR